MSGLPQTALPSAAPNPTPAATAPILRIENLSMVFGGLNALTDVSFEVNNGEILSLIGPNGAGKTTLFNCVTGVYRPTTGSIRYQPSSWKRPPLELTSEAAHRRAWVGITRTFQNIRLFDQMSAQENVVTGMHAASRGGLMAALVRMGAARREEQRIHAEALQWLEFVGLGAKASLPARDLPYGERRRVEIARALAARPKLICLDEPAAGMNPTETDELMALIRAIRAHGVTVFLIEHDMKLVMDISDRVVVLDSGREIARGLPNAVRQNPQVIKAYLGGLGCAAAEAGATSAGQSRTAAAEATEAAPSAPTAATPASKPASTPAPSPTLNQPRDVALTTQITKSWSIPAASSTALLQVRDLRVSYGVGEVLHGISFDIRPAEVVTIIGANGAGKTTTLRALSGIAPKVTGTVEFMGLDVLQRSPRSIVSAGLVHVPEGRRLFPDMTVRENLMLGAVLQNDQAAIQDQLDYVLSLFPILQERSTQLAGTLSGGQQQMCAISRGLMARPKLLMLDEPSLGLAPVLVELVFDVIVRLKKQGVTILLVEQNAHLALEIADRGMVLETGKVVKHGKARDLLSDPELQKAYLGG